MELRSHGRSHVTNEDRIILTAPNNTLSGAIRGGQVDRKVHKITMKLQGGDFERKEKNGKKPFSSAVFQGAEQQAGRVNIITANKICLLLAPIDVDLSCVLPIIHFFPLMYMTM